VSSDESPHFTSASFRFLKDLAANNNREWFAKNKGRYEEVVQAPAVRFVADAGPKLKAVSEHLIADARPFGGSISRIYRDVRFSKDKSPFRTEVGIHFSYRSGGGRMPGLPGFFLHLAPGETAAHSGVWQPEAPAVKKIRDTIANDPGAWRKAIGHKLQIEGESLARVPPGYPPDHPFAMDLRRKDFIASVRFPDGQVTSPKFLDTFIDACKTMNPLNQFLARAIGIPW